MGRLSGPSIAMIEWNKVEGNQIQGFYNISHRGEYFLEIVALFCEEMQWDTDIQYLCMENPDHHRITDDNSKITVLQEDNAESLGHWRWASPNQTEPLHTRYQPLGCRGVWSDMPSSCLEPMSLDRFNPYQFQWKKRLDLSYTEDELPSTSIYRICLIGLSHSRFMMGDLQDLLREYNLTDRVAIQHQNARYPTDIKRRKGNILWNAGCSQTLVAVAQWALARKPTGFHPPTPFPQYHREMVKAINNLRSGRLQNINLRSIHYNPLGDSKTTCPPTDWRNPPAIGMYNDILLNVSATMALPFIDTRFIMSPMWDSAPDWCHYRNKAGIEEARFILQQLLPQR